MTRYLGFALMLLGAGVLAACTSQPAMAPSHIAALHSGKLVVEQPAQGITVLTVPQEADMLRALNAALIATAIGGPFVGIGAGSSVSGEMAAKRERAMKILKPYAGLINTLSFADDFQDVSKKAVISVPWFAGSDAQVVLTDKPGEINTHEMEKITETSGVNAVVFLSPHIAFSPDLRTLYIYAIMRVYAQGAKGRAIFLDGGNLLAAAKLGDTIPALGTSGIESIAAGKGDDAGALGARANVWFENNGARIRQALASAEKIFTVKLHNFMIGRRGTSNPYKA